MNALEWAFLHLLGHPMGKQHIKYFENSWPLFGCLHYFFPKVRFFSLKFLTLYILLLLFTFTGPVEWLNHLKTQSMSEVKEVKRQETWNTAVSRAKLMHAWLIWNYDNELFMTVIIIKNSILFQGSKKRTEFLWTSKVQFSSRKGQVWFCSLN